MTSGNNIKIPNRSYDKKDTVENCIFVININDLNLGLKKNKSCFNYYLSTIDKENRKPTFTLMLEKYNMSPGDCNDYFRNHSMVKTHDLYIQSGYKTDRASIVIKKRSDGRQIHYLFCESCFDITKSLFKPTHESRLSCRKCHKLTYNSAQLHDRRLDSTNVNQAAEKMTAYAQTGGMASLKAIRFVLHTLANHYLMLKYKSDYHVEMIW